MEDPWSVGDTFFLRCSSDYLEKCFDVELYSHQEWGAAAECSTLCPVFFDVACHVSKIMHDRKGSSRDLILLLAAYRGRLFLVFDFECRSSAFPARPLLIPVAPSFPVDVNTYERLLHDVCMYTMTRAERLPPITLFYACVALQPGTTVPRGAILAKRLEVPPFSQSGVEVLLPGLSVPGASVLTRVHPVFECIVSPPNAIAVVEANGLVLRFVYVHALHRGVYIRVSHDRVDTSALESILRESAGVLGGTTVSGISSMAAVGGNSILSSSRSPTSLSGPSTSEVFLSALSAPSLYSECRAALLELTATTDALSAGDHPPDRMHPLATLVFRKRGRDMQQRLLSQSDLAARLSTETGTLQELNGLVYDVILQQCTLAEVPSEWNPSLFHTLPETGFLTVLYMLQWRHSLERFVDMAKISGADFVVPVHHLESFRVGILWQSRQVPLLQSLFRQLADGTFLFVFNAGRDAFSVKPGGAQNVADFVVAGALQTQSAKQRDTVTSFFLSQALYLVSAALTGGVGSDGHAHVMSLLLGIYMSNLHAYDLRHDYKNNQAVVRDLRALLPLSRRRR